jgi:hypothetical protein
MSQERILLAAVEETRRIIERVALSDAQAFALQVLADAADARLHPGHALDLDRLQSDYSVRVGSDRIYSI